MNTTNLLKIALRALANNKLRGFLTMLGIIIGVASVITMLAIGQGSKRSIQAQISEMGSNMIMIQPGADMRGGVRQDASAMETLKLQDYEDIVNETRYVSATSPSVNSSGQAIYGANNAPTTVYGISPDYMEIRRYEVEDGDMFSDQDVQTAAKVCVIGKTVVDNLFPGGVVHERELYILYRRCLRQQVIALEDEADLTIPESRPLPLVHGAHGYPV